MKISKLTNEQLIMQALGDLIRKAHGHDSSSCHQELQEELLKRGKE